MQKFADSVDFFLADMAAKLDDHRLVSLAELPGVAVAQPGVRQLGLVAVDDLLLEHAVAVTDAAAMPRQMQRGDRVEETGGQSAQSAAAQSGFRLLLGQIRQVDTQFLQPFGTGFQQIEVQQVGGQDAALQVFDRKIIDLFDAAFQILLVGTGPLLGDQVADQTGQRLIALAGRSLVDAFAVETLKLLQIGADKGGFVMIHENPPL